MKVYICVEDVKNDYSIQTEVVKVFFSEEKASEWQKEDWYFRKYFEMEVE